MEGSEPDRSPPSVRPTDPDELAAGPGFRRSRATRPLGRKREPSLVAGTYGVILAGGVLLVSALFGTPSSGETVLHVVAGLLAVAVGAAAISELLPLGLVGWLAMAGGAALGVSGLTASPIEGPEVGRLAAGAILMLGGAGLLAALRRP